jgi:hypothetical protein
LESFAASLVYADSADVNTAASTLFEAVRSEYYPGEFTAPEREAVSSDIGTAA